MPKQPAFEGADEAPSPASPSTPAPDDIRALILDLSAKIDAQNQEISSLRSKVRETEALLPRFQPSAGAMDHAAIFSGMRKGQPFEREDDHARLVIGTDGHPLSNAELRRSPPLFDIGDVVTLNLEVTPRGADKTWGEIVEAYNEKQRQRKKRLPSLVGRVRYIQYRRDDGSYKYRVVFPGLTALNPEKDRGAGFDQDELLAAS